MPALKLVTAPSSLAVALATAKTYLRITGSDEDAVIQLLIESATNMIEETTRRKLVTQTWDYWLDNFPLVNKSNDWWDGVREGAISEMYGAAKYICIPIAPLQTITFLKTIADDQSNTEYTFDATNYVVDNQSGVEPRIALRSGFVWPATVLRPVNGIQIRGVFGYGVEAYIPSAIRQAILETVAFLYENRGDELKGIPKSALNLLNPYMIRRI